MDLEHLTEQEKVDLRERLKNLRKTASPISRFSFATPQAADIAVMSSTKVAVAGSTFDGVTTARIGVVVPDYSCDAI